MRILPFIAMVLWSGAALAASSGWQKVHGGKVRLLARAVGPGQIEAALDIKLDAGWKTYWVVPGSSGVPPQINLMPAPLPPQFSAQDDVTIRFPVPSVFHDGTGQFAGYKTGATFLMDIENVPGVETLNASGMLGVCAEICVPVQFALSVELAAPSANPVGEQSVFLTARSRLPTHQQERVFVRGKPEDGKTLDVAVPPETKRAFWLDLQQGAPVEAQTVEAGTARFVLPSHALAADEGLVVFDEGAGFLVSLP